MLTLENLNFLILNFEANKLKSSGVKLLCQGIIHLKKLTYFSLNLNKFYYN